MTEEVTPVVETTAEPTAPSDNVQPITEPTPATQVAEAATAPVTAVPGYVLTSQGFTYTVDSLPDDLLTVQILPVHIVNELADVSVGKYHLASYNIDVTKASVG